jgi:hypothetical protein
MSDSARITLELLIRRLERLEPAVGKCSPAGYWVGDKEEETETRRRLAAGVYHLLSAIRLAREALASKDTERVEVAAFHCTALERDGLKLAARYDVTTKRRSGGKRTGEAQTAKAIERYAQWQPRYLELLAKGKSRGTVLHILCNELEVREIFVSTRSLGKWLPLKKSEGS